MIEEFKKIYESEFRETLTDAEAQEKGMRLIRVFLALSQNAPEQEASGPLEGTSPV